MKGFFRKPYRWASIFSILLIASSIFMVMDTFVIEKSYAVVSNDVKQPQSSSDNQSQSQLEGSSENQSPSKAVVSDNSYEDQNIKISIETMRKYGSDIYVADIQLKSASYLKTALAGNAYGRNIKAVTSEIAANNKAILAVNGDFYGFRNYGYVLRNGVLYRNTPGDGEALVIDKSGNFSIINENEVSTDSLDIDSISQIISFGPALIKEGTVVVDNNSEVSRSMNSNPRTAIGQISDLHYILLVSDGRTSQSAGLSLLQLADIFKERGCTTAYNLDGGGSSAMYFNGKVINKPTDGRRDGEREVSDIVYIGY